MLLTMEHNASIMGTLKDIIGEIPENILSNNLSIFDSGLIKLKSITWSWAASNQLLIQFTNLNSP